MQYHIFKKSLSPEAQAAVNRDGWSASPEGMAYADLRFVGTGHQDTELKVLYGLAHGIYRHAVSYSVPFDDQEDIGKSHEQFVKDHMEKIFEHENNHPLNEVTCLHMAPPFSSMSVGDIVCFGVMGRHQLFICASVGFEKLPDSVTPVFEKFCVNEMDLPDAIFEPDAA